MRDKRWPWSRNREERNFQPEQRKQKDEDAIWDTIEELPNDPRIGKRVFCLSLLPDFETYGTIKKITRHSHKNEPLFQAVEYWRVQADVGINRETMSIGFELYKYATEFQRGDQVRCDIDEGGYWEGVILRPLAGGGQLSFLVQIRNVQTRRGTRGEKEAHSPGSLTKL
jgi:hypothetical protein